MNGRHFRPGDGFHRGSVMFHLTFISFHTLAHVIGRQAIGFIIDNGDFAAGLTNQKIDPPADHGLIGRVGRGIA